ncbi:MAG TPA: peptide ABC transporter substrate-binding protein [Chloroflexota bacterium]|nr:peptide ABC transporter substrate-binding protein [Chloroflexota bacterium]
MLGRSAILTVVVVFLASCGPGGTRSGSGDATGPAPASTGQDRTVTMAVRYEPPTLLPKAGSGLTSGAVRPFNAELFIIDGDGVTKPYLAASLPQLNSDAWRVEPDGRMEVTYQLKPGLTWHDGQPLTADDFAFAYRVYANPASGMFPPTPQNLMDSVEVRDPQTFVISWNKPYPDAANLAFGDFEPLPRHILEGPFRAVEQDPNQQDSFRTNPFFAGAYVGAGPYRLERWEPGTELVGVAFDGHALGRARINRFVVRVMPDENAVLSNLLAGHVTIGGDFTLRYEHGKALKADWDASKRGIVKNETSSLNHILVQFRPDYLKVPALLDLRVRRALAYSIDRDGLNEGIFDGNAVMTETGITHDARYFPELDKAMTHYPYDPRRTEQLMNEAGFTKDAQGKFASASGERFSPEFIVEQGTVFERMLALMTETWGRAGIEVQPGVLPTTAMRSNEARATFSALYAPSTGPGERTLQIHSSGQIGSPANGWIGGNRGGWSNPEYDRLFDLYSTTLERSERDKWVIEMVKLYSEQLPAYYTYFNIGVLAYQADLKGPAAGSVDRLPYWNVYEWEFAST